MKILILNGPNLNMLGIREPEVYGNKTYKELCSFIKRVCKENKIKEKILQSNIEGKLVTYIQKARNKYDYIIINAGGYTHSSVAIHDAIKASKVKTIEVHLSNPDNRENFRKINIIRNACVASFKGKGFDSYKEAIEFTVNNKKNNDIADVQKRENER